MTPEQIELTLRRKIESLEAALADRDKRIDRLEQQMTALAVMLRDQPV